LGFAEEEEGGVAEEEGGHEEGGAHGLEKQSTSVHGVSNNMHTTHDARHTPQSPEKENAPSNPLGGAVTPHQMLQQNSPAHIDQKHNKNYTNTKSNRHPHPHPPTHTHCLHSVPIQDHFVPDWEVVSVQLVAVVMWVWPLSAISQDGFITNLSMS